MPPLSKHANCSGCGSRQHQSPCCPNRPCACCGERHPSGIRDCPIFIAAQAKVNARRGVADAAAAAKQRSAATAAKRAADAKLAEKRAERVAVRVHAKMVEAVRRQQQWAKFRALSASGTVLQPHRSVYTKANWEIRDVWSCDQCSGTLKFCVCRLH